MSNTTLEFVRWHTPRKRRGTITALTAVLLPVLLILSVFSINVAYMQLTKTELKVATDAATRAAGRALSEYQDVDQAILFAKNVAKYILFLAENVGISDATTCGNARVELESYSSFEAFHAAIASRV